MAAVRRVTVAADAGQSRRWGEDLPLRPLPNGRLLVDLSSLEFAEPPFLIRLRGFIDWHVQRGHEIDVVTPQDRNVQHYLSRMGVAADLPGGCTFDLGQVTAHDRRNVLIPLRRLRTPNEVDALDEELADLFDAHFHGDLARLREAFQSAVFELCDNATTHGHSEIGAYVAAQRYETTRCVLAIGDLGVGIPNHIRQTHPNLLDDGRAIERATQRGATGTGEADRGNGYHWIVDAMEETKVPKGSLQIWAGSGRFTLDVRYGEVRTRRGWSCPNPTAGTWVRVELSTC